MKGLRRGVRTSSSGQLFLVAALAVAILISSTTMYIYRLTSISCSSASQSISDLLFALKQSTLNTLTSSLVNASRGGEVTALTNNLHSLSLLIRNCYQPEVCHLAFSVANESHYDSGILLSWDTNGRGLSSVCANFTLQISGSVSISEEYGLNITTATIIEGSYARLDDERQLVLVTCNVLNEGRPALARNVSLYYLSSGRWMPVNASHNLSIVDRGVGTYTMSFVVDSISPLEVSVHSYDMRGIFIRANTTCHEV